LEKVYNHKKCEEKWFNFWERKGYFHPIIDWKKKHFSIVIPPPNVTGSLHMGHALNNTLQDIFTRYRRMQGYVCLWLPGTDHAGIATQNVVEKVLSEKGFTRWDLGREKFLKRVWEWKEKYGSTIINQLKKLGCSCDWERERFTMDDGYQRAVKKVFVQLYYEGLIYKGNYVINWCPRCETALSDLEVERRELKGKLWYIRYLLKEESGFISVATTRPETMLGDTAVAVNPNDNRYKHLIGKKAVLPLLKREIPIVADEVVNMDFGTGAVKVTPAHDFVDFEIAQRHNLPFVNIFTEKGAVNREGGKYEGLDRFEARERVLDDLKKEGLLQKVEDYNLVLAHCYRCDTVVEPRLSRQWFIKMKPLAEPAIEAVKKGKVRFFPKKWEKVYFDWMENIRDWCISRQIWWGHQIPVFYCDDCSYENVTEDFPEECESCGSKSLRQDEDVLDTWFSSALWPFATLGWPEETEDLKYFYPTSLLVTAHDIIFFWVARMIMMGIHFMKEAPFKDVLIHTLVRDIHGQKMSKSRGNVIDPLLMIDEFGADALRFTLAILAVPGRDVYLSEERIAGYRDFCNKIWNASRFILMNLDGFEGEEPSGRFSLADEYILSRYASLVKGVSESYENYNFSQAAQELYSFFWDDFCDWYIEISKISLYRGGEDEKKRVQWVLNHILNGFLRLLHPLMPFLTEEIWQLLPKTGESIMISSYPEEKREWINKSAEDKMETIKRVVGGVRSIKSSLSIPLSQKVEVYLRTPDGGRERLLKEHASYISFLARAEVKEVGTSVKRLPNSALSVEGGVEICIPLGNVIDFEREKERLSKKLAEVSEEMEKARKKVSNEGFLKRAPASIVEREKEKFKILLEKKEKLERLIRSLKE
jgi:valyl-tRNA synthetase